MDISKESTGLADLGPKCHASVTVWKKSSKSFFLYYKVVFDYLKGFIVLMLEYDEIEFDQLTYKGNSTDKIVYVKLVRNRVNFKDVIVTMVIFTGNQKNNPC